jgi:NAD+ kinase
MSKYNTIALIGKYDDPSANSTIMELHDFLKSKNKQVLLDADTAVRIKDHSMEVAQRDEIGTRSDLAIVIGGDGTLLNAARTFADYDVPLLGINLGRLGFLVDVSSADMKETIEDILNGNSVEEERFLLNIEIDREGNTLYKNDAFNDVVIHKSGGARMIELETYINGKFLHTIRADGLIISTPTGSTAYAMSAGGPILNPSVYAISLVPICPHSMNNRPIVLSSNTEVEVHISNNNFSDVQVTCDGQLGVAATQADRLVIKKKEKMIRLIHPSNYDYYDILRKKLHWGARLA